MLYYSRCVWDKLEVGTGMLSDHNASSETCMNPSHVPHVVNRISHVIFSIILKILSSQKKRRFKRGTTRFASASYTIADVFKGTLTKGLSESKIHWRWCRKARPMDWYLSCHPLLWLENTFNQKSAAVICIFCLQFCSVYDPCGYFRVRDGLLLPCFCQKSPWELSLFSRKESEIGKMLGWETIEKPARQHPTPDRHEDPSTS
jgi:hypothetical protein